MERGQLGAAVPVFRPTRKAIIFSILSIIFTAAILIRGFVAQSRHTQVPEIVRLFD
jgi:hypothetical protein